MSGAWSTRANALTLLRLLAAPPLVVAVRNDAFVPAAALFAIAVATDFADGWVARRYGEVSALGGLVDHAVDATFVTCGTAALASTGVLQNPREVLSDEQRDRLEEARESEDPVYIVTPEEAEKNESNTPTGTTSVPSRSPSIAPAVGVPGKPVTSTYRNP